MNQTPSSPQSTVLTKNDIQKFLDCAMGETPFDSITQRCQTADCLAGKLTTHRDFRSYNVYISFFIHRFIQFVQMQMEERDNPTKTVSIESWYGLLCAKPGRPTKWQYVARKTNRGNTDSAKNVIRLYHVEIIPPNKAPTAYGNVILIAQNDNAIIIPFDVELDQLSADIPWHEITGQEVPYNVHVSNATNPMLSLLWLHATLHIGGEVMGTMRGRHAEMNGMAMYELQMADLLIPTGNIKEILTQYENERVGRI